MTIGEVASRTAVPASTLRYYERAGVLPRARRQSGQRRYHEGVMLQIALIQLARQAGFTLGEVRDLFGDFRDRIRMGARFRALASRKLAEIEARIRNAEAMKAMLEEGLRYECLTLEDCSIVIRHMATYQHLST